DGVAPQPGLRDAPRSADADAYVPGLLAPLAGGPRGRAPRVRALPGHPPGGARLCLAPSRSRGRARLAPDRSTPPPPSPAGPRGHRGGDGPPRMGGAHASDRSRGRVDDPVRPRRPGSSAPVPVAVRLRRNRRGGGPLRPDLLAGA